MLDKNYDPKIYEDDIYKIWEDSGAFHHEIDKTKEPFSISMPPPNATGVLHTGHAVMLALEDIMTRYARMRGYCTLWLPGTDHAAIATQNKVEKILHKEGIDRHILGRERFLDRVRDYVSKSQDTIRNQIKKMGSSCDWERERYTFDKDLTEAVNEVFVKMYNDGLIYRGYRIVNWCPRCASTLADDEVEYKEVDATLYHIKYGPFVIATSRPETKLGDTAAAVNPEDKRYKDMVGKIIEINLAGHIIKVKVIADHNVDMGFGSGVVGVTPAHSIIDFEMGQKNGLDIIQVINEEGKMTDNAGQYKDMNVLECREAFVKDLREAGLIVKEEPYKQNLSVCYRCHTTVEPLMSKQWFIDVNKKIIEDNGTLKSIKEKSIEVIENGDINIVPDKFNKTYFSWMRELRDWCISRQIWWGHRIPVWYCKDCNEIIVAKHTPNKCKKCKSKNIFQDEDTLDTWFSSGLWTFSTLGWPKDTEELRYFHPTSIMETGYDILFFWVARMIIMSTYVLNDIPFKTVYLHGLIRTKDGQKMSKSHPETCIDPLDVIEKYGADALRLSLIIGTAPGSDTKIFEEKISNYRNFINKIWNASRFALMNIEDKHLKLQIKTLSDAWIVSKLQKLITSINNKLEKFLYSEAGQELYEFLWHDFCDWYLEISKEEKNDSVILYILKTFLKLMHPFTPYITEVLWKELNNDTLLISEKWPEIDSGLIDDDSENIQLVIIQIIKSIRNIRTENQVEASKKINVIIYGKKYYQDIKRNTNIIKKLARINTLNLQVEGEKIDKSATNIVAGVEIFIPFEDMINIEKEKERLCKEIKDAEKYQKALENKLNNKKFIARAPKSIVEEEKNKFNENTLRLKKLKESLNNISL